MTQESSLSLEFAAITDIGCRRSNNEDSFGYDAEQKLYVVCDGMGGNAGGEVASAMAVRTLIESFGSTAAGDPGSGEPIPVENRLAHAIYEANRVVREASIENPELDSMGTTLVCACLDGNRIVIGNVGDSRAYLVRNGECAQITQDHSFLDEEVRKGNMTPEMAAASNLQSVITRAIGVAETVEPDLYAATLQPEDMLLLASDGLTRYAHTEEISQAAARETDLTRICSSLIEYAKERGGADNITCILLRAVTATTAEVEQTPADSQAI
ncbi:Stp1/IreP family PP2C-type Ser/Thr phosphatase [Acidobacteria bacterium AB60]|nr:Stp1/IreP family PP2C-type Ser/Thr phosphatase [Acidobacteria bacterium AB60]